MRNAHGISHKEMPIFYNFNVKNTHNIGNTYLYQLLITNVVDSASAHCHFYST